MKREKQSLTKEQIHGFSRKMLEEMVYSLLIQVDDMNEKMDTLVEMVALLKNEKFGRSTEELEALEKKLGNCFNESEVTVDQASEEELEEPEIGDINPLAAESSSPKRKSKGLRENLIRKLPERDEVHELKGTDLICTCGATLREIGEDVTTQLEFHPATFEIVRHHIKKYVCDKCDKFVRAEQPTSLFEGSLATPSLLSGIATGKFVNALTYYRLESMFADSCAFITRPTMARWMIRTAEDYFSLIYQRLKEELLSCSVIHADETTVEITKDGRKAGTKSYMWVYTKESAEKPVVLYEYQKTRKAQHPKEFLQDYKGWLCCDGYEGYHSLGSDITVCGCWVHAKRHYSNAVKALAGKRDRQSELTVSGEALKRIGEIFHLDNSWKDLSYGEHLQKRQTILKEKIDSYYEWVESKVGTVPPKSETGKGLSYSLNQKKYLLGALSNPDAPLDNSQAERSIRNFVISRKNFVLIDTLKGAEASAIMFSMSETAKANHLKPYNYFEYLLTELPKHMNDNSKNMRFLDDLLPWSDKLPAGIRKETKT